MHEGVRQMEGRWMDAEIQQRGMYTRRIKVNYTYDLTDGPEEIETKRANKLPFFPIHSQHTTHLKHP